MFVLGLSSSFYAITVVPEAMIDAIIMLAVNVIGFILCLTARKLNRAEGAFMILTYAAYTGYLLVR